MLAAESPASFVAWDLLALGDGPAHGYRIVDDLGGNLTAIGRWTPARLRLAAELMESPTVVPAAVRTYRTAAAK